MADTTAGGIGFLACIIVFTIICAIFLLLRLWAARIVRRPLYLDDGLVAFAFAATAALSGTLFWLIFNGMGKHITEITTYELGVTFQVVTAAYICWTLGTGAIKLSILIMYMRIFRTAAFRKWAYVIMGGVAAFTIAFFVVFLTNCTPVSQMWEPVPWGHCRTQTPSEFASLSCSLALDLAIIILPFPWLWKLQMPLKNKVTVSITLSIGFLTIGVMIWRIPVTIQSDGDGDFTYHLLTIALITMLELWLGIIVACIPTLAPLLKRRVIPVVSGIIKTLKSKAGGGSAGTTEKEHDAVNLVTIGGSGGTKQRHYTSARAYTELDDSQEASDDTSDHTRKQNGQSLRNADPELGNSGPLQGPKDQHSFSHPYFPGDYVQAVSMSNVTYAPQKDFGKTDALSVPRGVIHVQRNFSTTHSHEP